MLRLSCPFAREIVKLGCRTMSRLAIVSALCIAPTAFANPDMNIKVANGEDLAPIDRHRAIVSSMVGGGRATGSLLLIDMRTGKAQPLEITTGPATAGRSGRCDAAVPATALQPHGIALWRDSAGDRYLYVVNHGTRESVEIYRFVEQPSPHLVWKDCVTLPENAMGNSVAVARDGSFYATNLGQTLAGAASNPPFDGEVLSWRDGAGWRSVPGSEIKGANGLLLAPDEKTIFVAGWAAGTVVAVSLDSGETKTARLPFLPDNLRWSDMGTILATGHKTGVEAVIECYVSSRATCDVPSAWAEIEPDSLAVRCVHDAPVGIATSTIAMGDELLIGSVRNPDIARIKAPLCGKAK